MSLSLTTQSAICIGNSVQIREVNSFLSNIQISPSQSPQTALLPSGPVDKRAGSIKTPSYPLVTLHLSSP